MQTAQRVDRRLRPVVLNEGGRHAVLAIARRVVRLHEKATRIAVNHRFDHEDAGQLCRDDAHRRRQPSTSSSPDRYCPYVLDPIPRASRARSSAVIYPIRYAISSRQATISPWRSSTAWM